MRFDYAGARTLFDALNRAELSQQDIAALYDVQGLAGMVDNVTRFIPALTRREFEQHLLAFREKGKEPGHDGYVVWDFKQVQATRGEVEGLIGKLSANEATIIPQTLRELEPFRPQTGPLAITVYFVAGGVSSDSRPGSISGRADQNGAYVLNGVPPGHAVLSVWSKSQEFEKSVDVPAGQDLTLDLVFATGARLSGRVTQGGQPAANRMVYMRPVDDTSDRLYQSMTSAEGQYEIEGLPPGEYFMRAYEDISRRITVAGDAVLNIDIPSVQLSARVVEDGGAVPIVGANVFVRGSAEETARVRSDRQTDDFGQVSLTGIDNGDIVLMVYKAGYELYREKIVYSAPITDKTITLRRSAGVEVRVKPGSRRFPRGFTLTQSLPGNDYVIDLWMPLDREGLCHVPGALAGTRFEIGRFSGKPIVFEEWDGQPFELP